MRGDFVGVEFVQKDLDDHGVRVRFDDTFHQTLRKFELGSPRSDLHVAEASENTAALSRRAVDFEARGG